MEPEVPLVLESIRKRRPWVKQLFAEGACDPLKLMDKASYPDFLIEVVQ